jgi:hypothetical protein
LLKVKAYHFLSMKPGLPPPNTAQRRGQRLLFVAVLFALLLTYPLLAAFDHGGRVVGVPVLYLYVLVAWLLLIGLTGWLVRAKE